MLCLAVEKLPEGPAWQYEVKLDGYRAIGVRTKAGAKAAGLTAIWLNREGRARKKGDPEPDLEIRSLSGLIAFLSA